MIYKNSQDLQRISIDLQIYSMSSDLQHKLTRIAANEQRRWWMAKPAAAAGTVTATGGHGSGLSVGGVVVTRMTTVTGRLEQCVDGLRPGGLAGGPQRSDKTLSVHSGFGCDGEPRG